MDLSRSRTLVTVLVALAATQGLHLLDELRTTDESLLTIVSSPQAISGIGGALWAAAAVHRGQRLGPTLATIAGALVGLGFLLVHGLPFASERTEPYWGDGSADVLQWLGVTAIWMLCVLAIAGARRLVPDASAPVRSGTR